MTNLRVAGGTLRKSAGFTSIVVVTLAVAIGANTAMFSIYDRLVLNPVTLPNPDSLTGLYSVLAYAVSQRTPEIGIRMALGASRGQVLQLVMRDGLGLVAPGLGLGLAAAAGATRLIVQLLFGVGALDPAVYAGVAAAFAIVAALACLGPSLRASRIDPLTAFKAD